MNEKKSNKRLIIVIGVIAVIVIATVVVAVLSFGGSDDEAQPVQNSVSGSDESGEAADTPDASESPDAPSAKQNQTATAPEDSKYGNAKVYTNKSGNPAAKTESGIEVELTTENVNKLFEEYEKVEGTGSEEEDALLDQIQLLLEVTQNQNISE